MATTRCVRAARNVLLAVTFIAFPGRLAIPCSCQRPLPPLQALAEAASVFSGRVIAFGPVEPFNKRATFGVSAIWKGPIAETIDVFTSSDSAGCGIDFQVGAEYLVYAWEDETGFFTHLCSRTTLFNSVEAEELGPPIWEEGAAPPFTRGDANSDEKEDLADAVSILDYLFQGGPSPACLKSADLDDSGTVELTDAVYLLNFLFRGGPEPSEPFVSCGADPTADELGCGSSPGC
ncbi:MAG TPA: hypothetical protein VMT52_15175 [Planctomycetota bacterium]|nr:hypothetical protein [Planctomycetota bacterium]